MIRQSGRHGRGLLLPWMCVACPNTQGAHRPAEVVAVHREVGDGLMHPVILRETVTLAHLPGIAVAVGAVVPFDEGGVDGVADGRHGQAASTVATVPKTTRKSIFTTRPFSRVLCTVA